MDSSNSSKKVGKLGNTSKQISPSKRWCFTLFKSCLEQVKADLVPLGKVLIGGLENCPETGRLHRHGYVEFTNKLRPKNIVKDQSIHWEKCKGDQKSNLLYCTKGGDPVFYSDFLIPIETKLMTYLLLRSSQQKLVDLFRGIEDPLFGRSIYWFYEEQGGWGKSICAKYMVDQMGALEVSSKASDAFFGIVSWIEKHGDAPPIIILDIPRSTRDYVSYQSIEKIKDGKFFSSKYESSMVRFNSPHVICFANELPDIEKMSEDRWIIEELKI
jgi:hypothetical protein